jgi:hypothetical protein
MNKIVSALTGTGNLPARLAIPALMSVLLLGSVVLMGACSKDAEDPVFPVPPKTEPRNYLYDVFGTAPNNVWACGARGVMFHYNGNTDSTWTLVPTGATTDITDIWGPGDGSLYAVGHRGRIWRNSGMTWSSMESGTTMDLYSLGQFDGVIHAAGFEGTLRRLNGSTWGGAPTRMMILDENDAPTDTLTFAEDLASLTTVNSYFVGGAFKDPDFVGERIGTEGTLGMVLAPNEVDTLDTDWILRPISGEQVVPDEWVYCTTSDPVTLSRNYLGTSEGWLFRLTEDRGKKVWSKYFPSVTSDPGRGIRDIWLDGLNNVYMVTDEGTVVFQNADYKFGDPGAVREVLYDGPASLVAIWGTSPDNLFIVGDIDDTLLRCSHNTATGEFTVVPIKVVFPEAKAFAEGMALDKFGHPLPR